MATTTADAPAARTSRLSFSRRQALWGYALALPAVLLVLGLVAYPFFYAIYISFTDRVVGNAGSWVGFDNFRYLSHSPSFTRSIRNTITLVLVTDGMKLAIGLGLALLVNQQFAGRGLFRAFIMLPWAMPGFVAFLTWRVLYQPIGGGINLLLSKLGIYTDVIDWLGQKSTAMPAVIIATVWRGFLSGSSRFWLRSRAYVPIFMKRHGSMARMLWQRFWAVTFPAIRPVILVTTLLSSIWTANSFENIWLLTAGGPSDATMVFPVLAYFGMQTQRLGEAAAVSVAMVPVLAILVIVVTSIMQEDD